MRIGILTNEYPPHVYGGAGVHVEYLTRELARLEGGIHAVQVLSFGDQRVESGNLRVEGIPSPSVSLPTQDPRHAKLFDTLQRDIVMAATLAEVDVVHCHTWYTHYAGCLVQRLLQVPLVLTTHSLEPHRPWKAEQLGTAYNASTWVERTAYQNADGVVAVSQSMRRDVHSIYDVPFEKIRVIHNGIDLEQYRPTPNPAVLTAYGVDPDKPFVLFVGRITRQKGIIHLVRAIEHLGPGIQTVLCAGAPDTKEIGEEMTAAVARARSGTKNQVVWIDRIVPKEEIVSLYTHASLFVCPSVYEPFGIINLEAMACETAVVASAVGGIPEVVVPGETGLLVPLDSVSDSNVEPKDPERFALDLASAINGLMESPKRLRLMGRAARGRVEEHFGWAAIAGETLELYRGLIRATRP
jgi:alpha-maltose-1-phosphate synthase